MDLELPGVYEMLALGAFFLITGGGNHSTSIQAALTAMGLESSWVVMLALILVMVGSCAMAIEVARKLKMLPPAGTSTITMSLAACTVLFAIMKAILAVYVMADVFDVRHALYQAKAMLVLAVI